MAIFEDIKSSNNIIINDTMSDDVPRDTMTSEASGMSDSFTVFDWIVLIVCDFFPLVAN